MLTTLTNGLVEGFYLQAMIWSSLEMPCFNSYQNSDGYLRPNTVKMIWTPVLNTPCDWDEDGHYGMGWGVIPHQNNYPFCKSRPFFVSHTGGAIGARSVLLILPKAETALERHNRTVRGVVVAITSNLQNRELYRTALRISHIFQEV